MLKDEEIAETIRELQKLAGIGGDEDDAEDEEIPFTEETVLVQLMRRQNDLINQLIWVTNANPKARPPAPGPRPRTALAALEERDSYLATDAMLEQLVPGGAF